MNGPLSPQTLALTSTCRTISWSRLRGGGMTCVNMTAGAKQRTSTKPQKVHHKGSVRHIFSFGPGGGVNKRTLLKR